MIMMTDNVMITVKMVIIIITVEIIVFIKMTSLTYKNIYCQT